MSKLNFFIALFLMASSFMSYGQQTGGTQAATVETKVIAVVNQASWCGVCKANGGRFGSNIMPYATKGVSIVVNDLSNETTIANSTAELKKSSLYKKIYKTNRKGVGRMLQACGFVGGKSKSMVAGIVTFLDAKTFKVLGESSIAVADSEMKTIIDNLL